MTNDERIAIYVEVAAKRTFAGAIEWPGWCRSGRDEAAAIEALLGYGPRYARAVESFRAPEALDQLHLVERLRGGATTDFGAPEKATAADDLPLDDAELARQVGILDAAWIALDRIARAARGIELRKGPRGGGRDLDKILDHVSGAERGYLSTLGSRAPAAGETGALRDAIRATLRARARDEPIANPSGTRRRWSPRFFVRREVWHVLDHAWEIEDRMS